MKYNIIIFIGIVIVYFAILIAPIIPGILAIPNGLINIAVSLVSFAFFPRAFNNKAFKWLIAYIVILEMYVLFGKDIPSLGIGTVEGNRRVLIEMAYLLPIVSFLSIQNYLKSDKFEHVIRKSLFIIIIAYFLFILPFVVTNPTLLRDNVTLGMMGEETRMGFPNYTLMHAYLFLIPGLLYNCRYNTGHLKLFYYLLLFVSIYIIINTQITTTMILVVFYFLFWIIYNYNSRERSVLMIVVSLVIVWVLLELGFFNMLADYLVGFFEGTAAETKMDDLKNALEGTSSGPSNLENREDLHSRSLDTFANNIFFGGKKLGGHSYLIDRLGGLGLVGFIPFVLMLYYMIKMSLFPIKNNIQRDYYYIGLLGLFVFLYTKGLFGQEGYLFAFIVMPHILSAKSLETK